MRECQTIVRAALAVTQNADREILENAAIAIDRGEIVAMGPRDEVEGAWRPHELVDPGQCLVMPGLVNAHTHAAMTFLRGLADDLPLMDWLEKNIFPVEARLKPEIARLGSLLGYAEMLATGTTACVDMYIFEDAVFEAADQAGIRCLGGEAVFCFPSAACPDYRAALDRTASLADRYASHPRISVAVNPHSVYTTDRQILAACRDLALKLHLPIHIHLAETRQETDRCVAAHGLDPISWCVHNGLFEPRALAAHLVDVDGAGIERLAAAGVVGIHNPSSNMKLASGAAPASKMLELGLTVALGTDGPASNNSLSMFTEMGRAALLAKLSTGDPSALTAPQTLDMATIGGAAALGDSRLGALAPGFRADLIALDLSRPNMLPMHNPVSQIVYSASGQECVLTMVDGEILYRDGVFTRFNYADLLDEARSLRDFAVKNSG